MSAVGAALLPTSQAEFQSDFKDLNGAECGLVLQEVGALAPTQKVVKTWALAPEARLPHPFSLFVRQLRDCSKEAPAVGTEAGS